MTTKVRAKAKWFGSFSLPILAGLLISVTLLMGCGKAESKDILSPDERRWLMENQGRIVLGVEANSAPLVFLDPQGQPTGLAHDHLVLLEAKLGVRFQRRNLSTLDEIFAKVRTGEIQVVNAVMETPGRSEFISFTKPFITLPNVIIVRKDRIGSMGEGDLRGLRVSLVRSFATTEHLTDQHKGLVPDLVPDDLTGLLNVSFGHSDAGVFDLATASYLIQKKGITNLRVAGEAGLVMQLSMGTPKTQPQLLKILEKGLGAITQAERDEIRRRWINASATSLFTDRRFWLAIGSFLMFLLIIVGAVLIWNRALRRQVRLRTQELSKGMEALEESERKFRSYVDQSTDVIFTLDAQGTFLFVSPAWERHFGYPVSEVLGTPFAPFVHSDDPQSMSEVLSRVISTGKDETTPPYRVSHADGSWRWFVANGSRMSAPKGEFRFFGIAHDITEQKQAQDAFREKSEELERYFTSSLDLLCIADTGGHFIRLNPEWEKVLGYSKHELEGRLFLDFVHPDDLEATLAAMSKLSSQEQVLSFENRYRCKDGSYRWIEWRSHPQGDLIYAAARDITGRKQTEERLKLSEERYRFSLEVTGQIGWSCLPDGQVEDAPMWRQYSGQSLEEVAGWKWLNAIHPEDRESANEAVSRAVTQKTDYVIEYRLRRADGVYRNFMVRGILLFNTDGSSKEWVGTCIDITERKQAEDELHRSRELYAALFNLLPATGVVLTNDAGQIIEANLAAMEILGLSRSETLARTFDAPSWNIIRRDGTPMPVDEYASVRALRELRLVSDVEMGICRPDGGLRWLLTSATPIPMAGLGVAITFSDITEYKRAKTSLQESEEKYRTIFQDSPLGIFYSTAEGRFLEVNMALARMLGFDSPESTIREIQDIGKQIYVQSEDRSDIIAEHLHGKDCSQHLNRYRRKDGSEFVANLYLRTIPDAEGRPAFMEGIVEDISERVKAEDEKAKIQAQLQQSQKLESLGTLAGGVAHDMNNVLGAILGLASAHIGTQPPGSPLHQSLDTICKATERGGKMVKSLLSFARQSPAESHKLDVNAILKEQVALLERTTLAKVRLEIDLEAELRPIQGDASALTHAFMNLCVNAVDAMPENGTLTLHTRNVDNDWIEVVVEDTGMGMPKEVLEKAMEPFFTTKGVGKGTGLGLSMVFSTVKAHRGQMAIESEPGQGTRVRLRFPACEQEVHLQVAEPAMAKAAPIPHGTLKVLLVDDDELIMSSVQMVLEVLGHSAVSTAQSGEEALAILEAGFEPDLVILDMNMPGLGGIGTLPRLRALRPEVPVVLATGRVDQTALTLASAHPGVTLISKPFGLRELQKQIESLGLG